MRKRLRNGEMWEYLSIITRVNDVDREPSGHFPDEVFDVVWGPKEFAFAVFHYKCGACVIFEAFDLKRAATLRAEAYPIGQCDTAQVGSLRHAWARRPKEWAELTVRLGDVHSATRLAAKADNLKVAIQCDEEALALYGMKVVSRTAESMSQVGTSVASHPKWLTWRLMTPSLKVGVERVPVMAARFHPGRFSVPGGPRR